MKYVDEQGSAISVEGIYPDWNVWDCVSVEEICLDDGSFDLIMHCRKYTEEEIALRKAQLLQQKIIEQTAVAMQLCVMQANFSDEQALMVDALYPEWKVGSNYVTGDIRRYNDILYRALQNSTGAAEHTPDIAVSLWKAIKEPDESGVFPWVQPLGATDAYKKGDRVSHNDKIYISVVDGNVWEPGTDERLWTEEA